MRKLFKAVFVVLFVLAFSSAAPALSPEDALSARGAESVYTVMRVDDLSGLLQDIFSPGNIEMVASMVEPGDAQTVRLIASFVSQIPAKSVVIVSGITADMEPFMQIAASMPASVRPKLDRVADGTASGVELITLLLGDGAMMLAGVFTPEAHEGAAGPYYALGDAAFAARDDLLLIALSPAELASSIGALEKAENRLSLRRRFDSLNYWYMHMDMSAIAALAEEAGEDDMSDIAGLFRAPLETEVAFSSKPESFLVSVAVNILESLADTAAFEEMKPVKGANLFLTGGGKLLFALSGPLAFSADDIKIYPEFLVWWNRFVRQLERVNISESDVEDLLNGSFSVVFGSDATILGKRVPGGYLALTGREGAAARMLGKFVDSEEFAQTVPVAPLSVDGWDSVYMVDPALIPAPLLFGVMEDTFFVGLVDSDALAMAPELPSEVAAMLEEPLFGVGVIDIASIWNWLRQEIADPNSLLSAPLAMYDEDGSVGDILQFILEAEMSVPFVKIWSSELDNSFVEFSIADVPAGKRLLPILFEVLRAFM